MGLYYRPTRSYMYIAIKELSGKNGFIVEYSVPDVDIRRSTIIQKFFATRADVVNGLPAILKEAI